MVPPATLAARQSLLVVFPVALYNGYSQQPVARRHRPFRKDAAMQRIASWTMIMAGAVWVAPLNAQIITAQPARPQNPSPPYSAAYPPAYSAYPPTYSAGSTTSLLQSPEANTIRGWYRDYL